jgi:hypothetical protein
MIDSVVFAFGFRMRSGKDTAVTEILKQRGLIKYLGIYSAPENQERYDIRQYSFASALKAEVNDAARKAGGMRELFNALPFDTPEWVKYDPDAPMNDPMCPLGKQRSLLQFWGAEYRRAETPDYWVRKLANTIELEKPQIALISDLRFENEMQFVLQYGEAIRVDRDSLPPATHISETALEDSTGWSLILENNGSLEDFKVGAVVAFDELLLNFPQQRNVRQALGIA